MIELRVGSGMAGVCLIMPARGGPGRLGSRAWERITSL